MFDAYKMYSSYLKKGYSNFDLYSRLLSTFKSEGNKGAEVKAIVNYNKRTASFFKSHLKKILTNQRSHF